MTQPRLIRSAGDAAVGLVRHRTENRMVPLLQLIGASGQRYQVELTVDDVRQICGDLVHLLSANQEEVARWWTKLADGADGRPPAPQRREQSKYVGGSSTP
jgi:hypothetical protein